MDFLSHGILPTARSQAFHVIEDHDRAKSLAEPLCFPLLPLAHELCLELKGSTAEKDKIIFEGNEVESNYLLRSMVNCF